MKKIILSVAAVMAFGFANAQDLKSKKGENYLPEAGDWAISFNADGIFNYVGNAFNGNLGNTAPTVNFVDDENVAFVGKKFIDAKSAYRVVANLGFNSGSETTIIEDAAGDFVSSEEKVSGFALAAGLGKEWRRGNTRLQGFYGADALLTLKSTTVEVTETDLLDGSFIGSAEAKTGLGLGIGVQGFIGAEYFIFPKMSIGAQYTYRVGVDMDGEDEATVTLPGAPSVTVKGGKSSDFGFGSVGIASMNLTLHF